MPKAMFWENVPGVAFAVVHDSEAGHPSDEEWAVYVDDMCAHVADVKGVFVYTIKSGPSTSQRALMNKRWEQMGVMPQIVVMTGSRITRGIVTALTWLMGNKIRAYSTEDFHGAADALGLDRDEKERLLVVLKRLGKKARLEIDFPLD